MNESELETLKIDYLYRSIEDTQSTVRHLDTKVSFLFLVICVPIPNLQGVYDLYISSSHVSDAFHYIALFILMIWAASLYAAVKSIAPINTPQLEEEGSLPNGTFYSDSLFNFTLADRLFNNSKRTNLTLDQLLTELPTNTEEIRRELAYVKLKLTYIRGVKALRSSLCANLTIIWILMGGIYWLLVLHGTGIAPTPNS